MEDATDPMLTPVTRALPPRGPKLTTADRNRAWLAMSRAGLTVRQIAHHVGYSVRSVKAGLAAARARLENPTNADELAGDSRQHREEMREYGKLPEVQAWLAALKGRRD